MSKNTETRILRFHFMSVASRRLSIQRNTNAPTTEFHISCLPKGSGSTSIPTKPENLHRAEWGSPSIRADYSEVQPEDVQG